MSEINPHPPNPDPINPNSFPPPVASDVVRSKRSTRHSGNDNKQGMKNTGVNLKGMEGMEYEGDDAEDMETKDNEAKNEAKPHGKSHVSLDSDNVDDGNGSSSKNSSQGYVSKSSVSNTYDGMGSSPCNEIHVPVALNPVLSPSQGNLANSMNVNMGKEVNGDRGRGKKDIGVSNNSKDTIMKEKFVQSNVSFASAFKGLAGYRNNKLFKVLKAYGRASFARVLIEVDAASDLVENVEVCYESLGKSMNLRMEYAWKPPHCSQCKVFGHEDKACNKKGAAVEEKVKKEKEIGSNHVKESDNNIGEGQWREVRKFTNNEASSSRSEGQQNNGYYVNRGGSNNRGRHGFMGRGGMIGRGGMVQRNGNDGNHVRNVNLDIGGKKIDERLKPMARLENVGNDWASVISAIVNKPATNTIWSVIQTLIFGASAYNIWHKRNTRRVEQVCRSDHGVFKCIVDTVRLKLLGLNLKYTADVCKAAEISSIPIRKNEYYRKMVNELANENNNN
ncbi:Zinc knuckle CX2CX4HX4C [Artemisia annua]|uniref:Zinc knuckle CX2CX4HX4C n=1 Tax=Artemisia annua TaxID=35608 RepID=A0A2U1LHX7_ARTAN|nr:Zinc knuckle CX2CX4HX4C [Artemisia annua]